jgi:hypothetical protein
MSTDGKPAISASAPAGRVDADASSVEQRRAILRRFGVYAAATAPAMVVLMASRQSEAGSFLRNSSHNKSGGSSGGGSCAFSC